MTAELLQAAVHDYRTGQVDRALAAFETLVPANTGSSEVLFHFGAALRIAGRHDDAALAFSCAAHIDPALSRHPLFVDRRSGGLTFNAAYVELALTHTCNLHCDGCSAYSNYALKDSVTLRDLKSSLSKWSRRIDPVQFRIVGGEPTLHPQLCEALDLIRDTFPHSAMNLATNGFFLDRHPKLPQVLADHRIGISLSFHSNDPRYVEKARAAWDTLEAWRDRHGVAIGWGDNSVYWNRFYKGIGASMRPFEDADPVQSWKVCHSKHCINMIGDRLFKCPQIAGLRLVSERFDLWSNPSWRPYLGYGGIGPYDGDDELSAFLLRGPEDVCGMCPSQPVNYKKDVFNVDFRRGDDKVAYEGVAHPWKPTMPSRVPYPQPPAAAAAMLQAAE